MSPEDVPKTSPDNSQTLNSLLELYPSIQTAGKELADRALAIHPAIARSFTPEDLYQETITKLLASGTRLNFTDKPNPPAFFINLFRTALRYICIDEGRKFSGKRSGKDGYMKPLQVASSIDRNRKYEYITDLSYKSPLDIMVEEEAVTRSLDKEPWFIRITILIYLGIEPPVFNPENEFEKIIYDALLDMDPDESPFISYCINHFQDTCSDPNYIFEATERKDNSMFIRKVMLLKRIPVDVFKNLEDKKIPKRNIIAFVRYYIKGEDPKDIARDFNVSLRRIPQLIRDAENKLIPKSSE
jgi:DNA-directed RNA polymerase specialized sigma24 family protein